MGCGEGIGFSCFKKINIGHSISLIGSGSGFSYVFIFRFSRGSAPDLGPFQPDFRCYGPQWPKIDVQSKSKHLWVFETLSCCILTIRSLSLTYCVFLTSYPNINKHGLLNCTRTL